MMKLKVYTPDLRWDFDGTAYVRERSTIGGFPRRTNVDPTPAYTHDKALVTEMLEAVAASFPVGWPVSLNILPHETMHRTNGWASMNHTYAKPQKHEGTITLSAKRIPPHPAMTRYLVGHEYGHIVDSWISHKREFKEGDDTLRKEYADLRGVKTPKYYGPGQWHNSPTELLANDFRIIVAEVEPDFWPHPGHPHPFSKEMEHVCEWWMNTIKEFAA